MFNQYKTSLFYFCLLFFLSACNTVKAEFDTATLSIITIDKTIDYTVDVANDHNSRSKGLMHRRVLPENRGMLLRYKQPQVVNIWMKNTLLSLDIIYIDAEGMIVKIIEGAVPHSLESMTSGQEILAVLELNAGQVEKQQIKIGDKVINF